DDALQIAALDAQYLIARLDAGEMAGRAGAAQENFREHGLAAAPDRRAGRTGGDGDDPLPHAEARVAHHRVANRVADTDDKMRAGLVDVQKLVMLVVEFDVAEAVDVENRAFWQEGKARKAHRLLQVGKPVQYLAEG